MTPTTKATQGDSRIKTEFKITPTRMRGEVLLSWGYDKTIRIPERSIQIPEEYALLFAAAPTFKKVMEKFLDGVANADDDMRFSGKARDFIMQTVNEFQDALSQAS